jgi:hypothetical protein
VILACVGHEQFEKSLIFVANLREEGEKRPQKLDFHRVESYLSPPKAAPSRGFAGA